jgi:hypothetical protein
MLIPHWVTGLAILVGLAALGGYAFRQGTRVKPDRNKGHDDWSRTTGGGDGGHFG